MFYRFVPMFSHIFHIFTVCDVIYDPFFTRKPPISEKNFLVHLFALFVLSTNTTSQNIGRTDAWAVPHLKYFWGTVPPVPLGLRPCMWLFSLSKRVAMGVGRHF